MKSTSVRDDIIMTHFYMTLPSNASMKIYPNNTVAKYTTQLPTNIELDGEWEVALTEIMYNNSGGILVESDFVTIMVVRLQKRCTYQMVCIRSNR